MLLQINLNYKTLLPLTFARSPAPAWECILAFHSTQSSSKPVLPKQFRALD